jgi:hypothetical protein
VTKTQLVADMQKELESIRRENVDLNKQNANLKFKCQILEIKGKGLRREIESHAVTIADLTAQIDDKMHTLRALEVQDRTRAELYQEEQVYIECIEKEVTRVTQLLKRVSSESANSEVDPIANPVTTMRNLRIKARHELASQQAREVTSIMLEEWVRDKATITEGCMGLDRAIQYQATMKEELDPDYQDIQGVEEEV